MRVRKRFSKDKRKSFGRTKPRRRGSRDITDVAIGVSLFGLGLGLGLYMLNGQKVYRTPDEIAKAYGYRIKQIDGDGSCMFRSIADQVDLQGGENFRVYRYHATDYLRNVTREHSDVRDNITSRIMAEYEGMSLEDYLKAMKNNMWGDEITLQALSNIMFRRIVVIQFNSAVKRTEVIPRDFSTNAELPITITEPDIAIGLYGENHYVSLRRM